MDLMLLLPLLAVATILFFRSFNFSQFQGIFLISAAGLVLLSYYRGETIWAPIVIALVSEIIVNLLIGIKGSALDPKVYNYTLTALGLFPWNQNVWVSLGYLSVVAIGFSIGAWSRADFGKKVYSLDLMSIIAGAGVAAIIASFV